MNGLSAAEINAATAVFDKSFI
ncbi:hypothetical protein VTL71DRAFT_9522 [Oculimacula yallundae]|uniref:Uncharacterized protein n=1 Tax=Oculimacula yallundae TaxID=86028 RepID=A0ABR4BS59_9HELO